MSETAIENLQRRMARLEAFPRLGLGVLGSMYADDASIAVTIVASGNYYALGSGLSDGGSSDDFTFQNSRELLCNTEGLYLGIWSMSMSSATNNEIVAGTMMIGTTHVSTTEGSAECINSGKPVCVSGAGLLDLAVNDVVKLCVENETAAHNITITHANLFIIKISDFVP
jgi:hypothetical protein